MSTNQRRYKDASIKRIVRLARLLDETLADHEAEVWALQLAFRMVEDLRMAAGEIDKELVMRIAHIQFCEDQKQSDMFGLLDRTGRAIGEPATECSQHSRKPAEVRTASPERKPR